MKAFQLKIMIKNSKPPIWRRVIVPVGITFSQLSMILNEVMGWSGYHSFKFEFYHLQLEIAEDDEFMFFGDYKAYDFVKANATYIREYLEENDWFTYVYDFGDNWEHRVTIEKILDNYEYDYPQVVKYKGNCPLEDCGGLGGHYECLAAASDPENPEFAERFEWMEMQGYPNEYDMDEVNEKLKTMYFYQWGTAEKRKQSKIYEDFVVGKYGLKATKRDKNKNQNIQISGRHEAEASLKETTALMNEYIKMMNRMTNLTLQGMMNDFSKEDLDEIAKDKGLPEIVKYKKNTLTDRLAKHMLQPNIIESYFLLLQDREINAFEKLMAENEIWQEEQDYFLQKIYMSGYIGMLEDGSYSVPKDVAEQYKKLQGKSFDMMRQKVSYLYACLRAVSILHGITPISTLIEMFETNDKKMTITPAEIRSIVQGIPAEFSYYVIVKDMVYYKELYPNDRNLMAAQGDKKYYIPNREEILDLGLYGYLPNRSEIKNLADFLEMKMNMFKDEADYVAMRIQCEICAGGEPSDVMQILQEEEVPIETEKQLRELTDLIFKAWNRTRSLLNRGFTPDEMSRKPVVKVNNYPESKSNNVIDFQQAKANKIYPNAHCPCGSGKKYKHCCGKNKK